MVINMSMRLVTARSISHCTNGNFWRSVAFAALLSILFGILSSRLQAQSLQIVVADQEQPIIKTVPDLVELGLTEFTTSTVWTQGVDVYSGVLLSDLLSELGADLNASDGSVTLEAMDGYSATISFDTMLRTRPLLAFLRNNRPMSVRSQGPFWLIFDYDSDARLRTETHYAKSVWQISRLIVEF